MAGSRLEKFGTIFTRIRDLMRSGVIQPTEKPIWYDVYEAFPPKRDPLHVKQHTRVCPKKQETVPEIFFIEDQVRAKFYQQYGTGSWPHVLFKPNSVSTCQRFVDKYTELKSQSDVDESALFDETGKALLLQNIVLRKRGAPVVSAESKDPVLKMKLTDMLTEQQQSVSADCEETVGHTKP
ncbi:hypothetical protein PAMP_019155 [Pampus punctatissimus]